MPYSACQILCPVVFSHVLLCRLGRLRAGPACDRCEDAETVSLLCAQAEFGLSSPEMGVLQSAMLWGYLVITTEMRILLMAAK
jgi:hypothetical protein